MTKLRVTAMFAAAAVVLTAVVCHHHHVPPVEKESVTQPVAFADGITPPSNKYETMKEDWEEMDRPLDENVEVSSQEIVEAKEYAEQFNRSRVRPDKFCIGGDGP